MTPAEALQQTIHSREVMRRMYYPNPGLEEQIAALREALQIVEGVQHVRDALAAGVQNFNASKACLEFVRHHLARQQEADRATLDGWATGPYRQVLQRQREGMVGEDFCIDLHRRANLDLTFAGKDYDHARALAAKAIEDGHA